MRAVALLREVDQKFRISIVDDLRIKWVHPSRYDYEFFFKRCEVISKINEGLKLLSGQRH